MLRQTGTGSNWWRAYLLRRAALFRAGFLPALAEIFRGAFVLRDLGLAAPLARARLTLAFRAGFLSVLLAALAGCGLGILLEAGLAGLAIFTSAFTWALGGPGGICSSSSSSSRQPWA